MSAETRLVSRVLYLAACITDGVWTPVSEKDQELVLQIISISADLLKVGYLVFWLTLIALPFVF